MSDRDLLYGLLPAIYRIRDAERHGTGDNGTGDNGTGDKVRSEQLRALMGILQEQFDCLEADIAGLHEDWFIETCAEWVVPYIGDLLGVRLLHDIESTGLYSQRALVANTLRYRRGKGTLLVLEDLARDVTGWRARAVEFFELLGWTQHLDHLRYAVAPNPNPRRPGVLNPPATNRVGTVDLRSLDVVDRIGGPFDVVTHSVDVRPVGPLDGWYNIRNVGVFLWRLQSYPMAGVEPRRSAGYADGFHFSPLGNPAPLFTNPGPKTGVGQPATEHDVPGSIRPVAFFQDLEAYYGHEADKSLAVYRGTRVDPAKLIPAGEMLCKDLGGWSPPPAGRVAIDVERGRLAFAANEVPVEGVTVTYHQGFSGDVGGGPYDRRDTLQEEQPRAGWWMVVAKERPDEVPVAKHATSVAAALAAWAAEQPESAVITIRDSGTYAEQLTIALAGDQHLIVQAADRNRPLVRILDGAGAIAELAVGGGGGAGASLTLSGLAIEGAIAVGARSLGALELRHCTLVPGRALGEDGLPRFPAAPSLSIDPDNAELEVTIAHSIVGALRVPEDVRSLTVRDSIVDRPKGGAPPRRLALAADDAGGPGPPTTLERVTVFGDVIVKSLELASEVQFAGVVAVSRRQHGCVRYSWVDDQASITPRRFRCQPDLALDTARKSARPPVEVLPAATAALIRARVRPRFTADRFGRPGYAQLHWSTAAEIRTGAEDGAEMGVFERLKQPQREANLRARLEEYMPYGLQYGIVYVT